MYDFEASVNLDDYLRRCVRFIKPNASVADLRNTMYQIYETEFGVFDHINIKNRPLASVAFMDIEDTLDGSPMDSITRTYATKGMNKLFGISLLELINLPRDIVELLINVATEEQKKVQPALDQINAELGRMDKQ